MNNLKRPASSSSSVTGAPAKRQKTDAETDADAPTFGAPIEETTQPEATGADATIASNAEVEPTPAQDAVDDGADGDDALPTSPAAPIVTNEPEDVDAEEPVPKPAEAEPKGKGKKTKAPKQPPVKDVFKPWKPTTAIVNPAKNDFWGVKPVTGDPRPHADQPAARDSNAATNPPMWEERNYRFKRGTRYVKFQGPIKPEGADDGPDIDQEDFMVMKLIDMRPVSKNDQSARRQPIHYVFEHGKPKDWNNMQAVKALNDRRGQAIDRVVMDAPWSTIEREYLSELLNDHPDASIWELTELHNDRFKGRDFAEASGFTFTKLSTGRTVESVRAEYMTYKPAYDNGAPPENVRWRTDKSKEGKALTKATNNKMENTFGKPSKKLEKEHDGADGAADEDASDDESGAEGEETPKAKPQKKNAVKKAPKTPKTPKTPKAPKKETTKKSKLKKETPKPASPVASDNDTSDSDDEGEIQIQAAQQMAAQPKLNDDDEALLDLAGINHPEEIRDSPPHVIPLATPPRRAFSWSSDSDLSDIDTDKPDTPAPVKAAKSRAPSLTNDAQPASASANAAKTRAPSISIDAQPAQDVTSPGAVEFEAAVAAVSEEAVATTLAAQQPKSATPSVHEPSDQEVVVIQQTVVQQTITVEQQSARAAIPERSSPAPAPASVTPSPKAARDIAISDDYDDDDEDVEEDEDEDEEL